jgi:ectoine hydroxylase-related dioxygenase (phytanoyl-CoA dioxygenase family)
MRHTIPVIERPVLPTPEEVAFYWKNGWVLSELVISPEWLQVCKEAAEEVYEGKYDYVHPWSSRKGIAGFSQRYDDRRNPRLDAYVSLHKRVFAAVMHAPEIGAYAARLIGATNIRLYRDTLLTAPAHCNAGTGLHIDKNYWSTCSSDKLLTAWTTLEDCGPESGCLAFLSESHRGPRTSFIGKIAFDDTATLHRYFPDYDPARGLESVPHRRGQISFHSCLVLHGAHPNTSAVTRQALVIGLQDETNVYQHPPGLSRARASFNTNDRVGPLRADGTPDYQCDDFYPLIYDGSANV